MGKKESKRLTIHHKNKIYRKMKEKDRKFKKLGKGIIQSKSVLKKDPGIPNLWPYKKDLIEKIKAKKERDQIQKESQMNQKKMQNNKGKDDDDEDMSAQPSSSGSSVSQMAKLQFEASQRAQEFENRKTLLQDESDNGFRDQKQNALSQNSKRAYYREFKKVVEQADVIVEVLDARDPMGCRCIDVEKNIASNHPDKKIVLLLNKIDLVPREVVQKWLEYLRVEHPTIAFKSNTQQHSQKKNLGRDDNLNANTASEALRRSNVCLGATNLIQLLKNYSRSADIKKSISVGIIGYPNVGKSSVINSLKRTRVVNVGSMPGMTKNMQEVQLDSHITLLDCPGIVFSNADNLDSDIILRNAVRIEQLEDTVAPVEQILKRCKKERLMTKYNIANFESAEEFLTLVAKQRGLLHQGGKPRMNAAGRVILQDWVGGKIPFFTLPPQRTGDVISEFNQWASAINDKEDLEQIPTIEERAKEGLVPMIASAIPKMRDFEVTIDSDDEDDEMVQDNDEYFQDSDEEDAIVEDDSSDDDD